MSHARQFEFHFSPCTAVCPDENVAQTDVIVFKDNLKLRAHAVGHFANMEEMNQWRMLSGWDLHLVRGCIDALKDVGCPFFVLDMEHLPPCSDGSYPCSLVDMCQEVIRPLEDAYCKAICSVINATGNLPRYSRFKDCQNRCFCWMFSDQSILVKMRWNRDAYTVMTAYKPKQSSGLPFRAILEYTIKKIKFEAASSPVWCDPAAWGMETCDADEGRHQKKNHKKQKTTGGSGQYIRGGGRSWREFLDQEE